jgi:DNA-binding PadR family transcriptional regulator
MHFSELEFHVLVYLASSPEQEGYGWKIRSGLERRNGMKVPLTALYRALIRLHQHGLLDQRFGDPAESLAGSGRKYFRLNERGGAALRAAAPQMSKMVQRLTDSIAMLEKLPHQDPNNNSAEAE